MSNVVEKILKEIENGSLEVEGVDATLLTCPLSLPHCPYLAEDDVTCLNRRYDSLICLR
jgi:hypothetical protein